MIAALAIGQTLIILTAGIDLAVGATCILSMLVMANLAANNGVPRRPCPAHRHRCRHRLRVPQRLTSHQAESAAVHRYARHAEHLHRDWFAVLRRRQRGQERYAPHPQRDGHRFPIGPFRLTLGVIVVAVLAVIVAFILSQTSWGRHLYAVGDDIEAAWLVGIQVDKVLLSVYTVAGLIYGFTAWVLIGRAGTASPNAIVGANLETITAVVIGGTSLFGGAGGIIGTILGALIVCVQHRAGPGRRG